MLEEAARLFQALEQELAYARRMGTLDELIVSSETASVLRDRLCRLLSIAVHRDLEKVT